jgi:hypothetical protein
MARAACFARDAKKGWFWGKRKAGHLAMTGQVSCVSMTNPRLCMGECTKKGIKNLQGE